MSDLNEEENRLKLDNGWLTAKSSDVIANGLAITSEGHDLTGWLEAVVPGTVLTNLVHRGTCPDPYISENNNQIQDIFAAGRDFYTYWFYTTFNLSSAQ